MFNSKIPWYKRISKLLSKYFYDAFHLVTFFVLTVYVIKNWDVCISMQLFSSFDGNNILFLVWIILILLILYEVEGKGIKLRKRKQEKDQESIDNANYLYTLNTMSQLLKDDNILDIHSTYEREEGQKNEPSD